MAHQLPSGRWREQIRRKDFGYFKETFDTEAQAIAWKRSKLAELMGKKASQNAVNGKSLSAVIDMYFESSLFKRKADGTRRREKSAAKAILNEHIAGEWIRRPWADHLIDMIDAHDINSYIEKRLGELTIRGQQISDDSVRLEIRFLSPVFKLAVRQRLRQTNPALARNSGIEIPTKNDREGRISEAQELKLKAAARQMVERSPRTNACLYPWLIYTLQTMCRPGEAAKTELTWISLEKKCVYVPRIGSKKRNPRRILLTDDLLPLVKAQMELAKRDQSPYLFYSKCHKTKAWQPYQYATPWAKIRKVAGVTVEAHGMRREGISRLFEVSNLTDGQIALLVGDVNPMSLEPYKNLRSDELRPQMEAFRVVQQAKASRVEAAVTLDVLKRFGIKPEQLTAEMNEWMAGGERPSDMDEKPGVLPIAGSNAPLGQ